MLTFQQIPVDAAPSPALSARVAGWTFWSWFREPLDIVSLLCSVIIYLGHRAPGVTQKKREARAAGRDTSGYGAASIPKWCRPSAPNTWPRSFGIA
jgi:hypothetical protein